MLSRRGIISVDYTPFLKSRVGGLRRGVTKLLPYENSTMLIRRIMFAPKILTKEITQATIRKEMTQPSW